MRVVQLIDSLETGGAERVAVNYANELFEVIEFSALVVTRKEGELKSFLKQNVEYLFLNRKKIFDINAILKLRSFLIKNKIDFLHAHNTSYFFAFLIKLTYPKIKVVWHDHYGDSEFLNKRGKLIYKLVLPFFFGVIVVNNKLKVWIENVIGNKNVIYLPNFPVLDSNSFVEKTFLKGEDGKRIVCLANLRFQKNHFLLIDAAKQIIDVYPNWTFHLVGVDFKDDYSKQIFDKIKDFNLEKNIFFYGSCTDISNILRQSDIGILTSDSEGLPMAFLEYGLSKLPVVCTKVGEIPNIISNYEDGILVESRDVESFYLNLKRLISEVDLRKKMGEKLLDTIQKNFSSKSVISNYLKWLNNV